MPRRILIPCLAGLLLGLPACGGSAPAAAPAPVVSSAPVFGGTDRAWIEINIAMNDELVPLLALAPAQSFDAGVKKLAAQVSAVNERERAALGVLHAAAGLPAENQHKGMPMPGMVTPEILRAAGAAEGRAFDDLLRKQVRAHAEQGVRLAESEATSGVEPRSKELAARMIADRKDILATLPPSPKQQ